MTCWIRSERVEMSHAYHNMEVMMYKDHGYKYDVAYSCLFMLGCRLGCMFEVT